ncbi:ankyrin repeat domain-containing protein [Thermodesulfobacteriota bacterium]
MDFTRPGIKASTLLTSSLLLLWYFFDLDLSKTVFFEKIIVKDSDLYVYFLLVLAVFFQTIHTVLHSLKDDRGVVDGISYLMITLFLLSSIIISFPKIVFDTCLYGADRLDLLLPVLLSVAFSFMLVGLIVDVTRLSVFYKFRKQIYKKDLLIVFFNVSIVFVCFYYNNIFSSQKTHQIFAFNNAMFALFFVLSFILFSPKRKIFSTEKLEELSRLNDYLNRKVALSEAMEGEIEIEKGSKRLQKKAVNWIRNKDEQERKKYFPRFTILKELKFSTGDGFIELIGPDDDEYVLSIKIINKSTNELLDEKKVKFKYLSSVSKKFKLPHMTNGLQGVLEPMALEALKLQEMTEGDVYSLFWGFSLEGNIDELRELLKTKDFDIDHKHEGGWTALCIAVAQGHIEITNLLLQKAADANIENDLGRTPIFYAAHYGNLSFCKILLNYNANINHQDVEGTTALMDASRGRHSAVVKLLLEHGADIGLKDQHGKNAYDYAKEKKSGDIARLLKMDTC